MKVSVAPNECPHCNSTADHEVTTTNLSELAIQFEKTCVDCRGYFLDPYLLDFDEGYEEMNNKGENI